jgi:hypothetical protein
MGASAEENLTKEGDTKLHLVHCGAIFVGEEGMA